MLPLDVLSLRSSFMLFAGNIPYCTLASTRSLWHAQRFRVKMQNAYVCGVFKLTSILLPSKAYLTVSKFKHCISHPHKSHSSVSVAKEAQPKSEAIRKARWGSEVRDVSFSVSSCRAHLRGRD